MATEVALARLGVAQALVHEMPHTLAALESGVLSEYRAMLIVRESACLAVEHRGQLDRELCADPSRLEAWGNKQVESEAKKITANHDNGHHRAAFRTPTGAHLPHHHYPDHRYDDDSAS